MAAAAVSSSLLPFSHLNNNNNNSPRFLSLRPRSSPPRAAPRDSPDGERATGSGPSAVDEVRYKWKKRRRKDVIRREPIQIPAGRLQQEGKGEKEEEEPSANEGAFLLAWLGLGALILVEGVALAASGFLPEEWDDFFVKFLYPSFTPTVFLFVGLSVAYGVTKYFEAEKMKKN